MKFDADASSEMKQIPNARQRISHGGAIFHARSAFHKARKGFISLKKSKSFDLLFSGGEDGIRTHVTLPPN